MNTEHQAKLREILAPLLTETQGSSISMLDEDKITVFVGDGMMTATLWFGNGKIAISVAPSIDFEDLPLLQYSASQIKFILEVVKAYLRIGGVA